MSIPKRHPFDFDPSYGMTRAALLTMEAPQAPEGFDAFWTARYVRARAVEPNPVLIETASDHPKWRVHELSYISTDGMTIGGWLLLPRDGPVRRGLVVGHGYGGRDQPDYDLPAAQTAILFPCARGLSRSAASPIPADAGGHVLHGIEDKDHYVIGGCVEDLWVAVSVLTLLFPEIAGRIGYSGISFGGGLGALAIPYDERIDRGHLVVPTFGNRPLWLNLPTIGSAASVQAYRRTHPNVLAKVLETLRFFDAATAATRIRVPMLVAPALFDPAVAPPCQFSVANALPKGPGHEIFILDAGHFEYPGDKEQHAALNNKIEQFFRPP